MTKIVVSAPGKVILHGEHAVVYGKKALAASLNLRTFLTVSERGDNLIHLDLPDLEVKLSFPCCLLSSKTDSEKGDVTNPLPATEENLKRLKELSTLNEDAPKTQYLAVVTFLYLYSEISKCSKCPFPAVDVNVRSEIPIGAGLGSSASYSVCLAAGLLQLGNHISQSRSHIETDQSNQSSWLHDETELINKWAFICEQIMHGNPSGVDNSVIIYGGAIEFQKGVITKLSQMPETRILLVNTKVPRNTKTMVANVKTKFAKYEAILGPVMDAIDAVTTESISTNSKLLDNGQPSSQLYKELEDLIDMNQNLLRTLGVSHPKLDRVCEITADSGLHAKLTGAGGGGCAFCLIRPGTPQAVVKEVMSQLKVEGFECWETNICGQGVVRHWTDS